MIQPVPTRPLGGVSVVLALLGALCFACLDPGGQNDCRGCLTTRSLPSDGRCSSSTAPSSAQFWEFAFGDWGTGEGGQLVVAGAVKRASLSLRPRDVLLLGDNFYETGVAGTSDPQWQSKFEKVYQGITLNIPFYAVLGNHDYLTPGSADAEVQYTQMSTRWRMPSRYYTFVDTIQLDSLRRLTVRHIALETDALVRSVGVARQLAWLDSVLAVNKADLTVAFGHQPLFGVGEYGDTPLLHTLLQPRFEAYHVRLYLAGHEHNLQVPGLHNGVYYVISGSGSGIDREQSFTSASGVLFAKTIGGFAAIGVSSNGILVRIIDENGCTEFSDQLPLAQGAPSTSNQQVP